MSGANPHTWTRPADLRATLERRWNRGDFLSALAAGEASGLFPYRLPLKKPASRELGGEFDAVRKWIEALRGERRIRIEWKTVRHRILGENQVPAAVWIDTMEDVAALIGRSGELERFSEGLAMTRGSEPCLLPLLAGQPRLLLDAADDWPTLLRIVEWMRQHPRPGIYLRQLDVPGVHTKFIEARRGLLDRMLALALPTCGLDDTASGISGFNRRYGFLNKPERLRFRFLDRSRAILPERLGLDLTLDAPAFAKLNPAVSTVFITENEINFLAFPDTPDAMILFGAGYGFDALSDADWMRDKCLYYQGDIDTHGFAILDQFRNRFPATRSFCMDRETLLAHRELWGSEPAPTNRELTRLTPAEAELYEELRTNFHGRHVRLEQERIGFQWLTSRIP